MAKSYAPDMISEQIRMLNHHFCPHRLDMQISAAIFKGEPQGSPIETSLYLHVWVRCTKLSTLKLMLKLFFVT